MSIDAKVRSIPNAHMINKALGVINAQVNTNIGDISAMTASEYLTGITPGTALASKAIVLDASKQIDVLDILTHTIPTATPVNAVAASTILDVTGVVLDSETATVGADTYEFAADTAQTITGGNIAVDITASTTASAGTLTMDTQPVAGKVIVIGASTYTWVPLGTANADGEVDIGADLAAAKVNIIAAIDGSDGFNTVNASALGADFIVNDSIVTALVGGVAGDSIVFTTTMAAGTNGVDGAGTLGTAVAGSDCTAANAITALVAAEVASGTEPVGFVDGAGDTIDITATVSGVLANAIATTNTMSNATFTGAVMAGGIDGTVGVQWEEKIDATYRYECVATNTIADANWRRQALGSAY